MNRIGIRRKNHVMWTPEQRIAYSGGGNLNAWFDASNRNSLTLVNSGGTDYVSFWYSRVNAANMYLTQSDGTRRPFYLSRGIANRPCVKFIHGSVGASTCDFLAGSTTLGNWNSGAYSLNMFVAARQTNRTLRAFTGNTTENGMLLFGWLGYHSGLISSCNTSGYQQGFGTTWWDDALTTALSATHIFTPGLNSLTCYCGRVNGSTTGNYSCTTLAKNYNAPRDSAVLTNREIFPSTVCRMGTASTTTTDYSYPFEGEMYELILIAGTLDHSYRTKVLEYLNAKWGP